MVERLKRRQVPTVATRVLARRDLDAVDGFELWEGVDRLSAVADPPISSQADGESLGMIDAAEIEWMPDTLRIVAGQA